MTVLVHSSANVVEVTYVLSSIRVSVNLRFATSESTSTGPAIL